MFLRLDHTKLDVFILSQQLILFTYQLTLQFPREEQYALTQQLRRAVVSVHLNIAEGCSRKSVTERKRFFEISRGSLVEMDTILTIAVKLGYVQESELVKVGNTLLRCFQIISKMINT